MCELCELCEQLKHNVSSSFSCFQCLEIYLVAYSSPRFFFFNNMIISGYWCKYTCNCQLTSCYYFQSACGTVSVLSEEKNTTEQGISTFFSMSQDTKWAHYQYVAFYSSILICLHLSKKHRVRVQFNKM